MDEVFVVLRTIVSLGLVLALLLFLSRRLQKGQRDNGNPLSGLLPKKIAKFGGMIPARKPGDGSKRTRDERITVIAKTGLSGKAQLVVAEFGGLRYVLGVTEHGVSVVDTQEVPRDDQDEDEIVEEAPKLAALEQNAERFDAIISTVTTPNGNLRQRTRRR